MNTEFLEKFLKTYRPSGYEKEGGELKHSEYLGDSVSDPRRALAEQLCCEIPRGVCTTAYNKGFECGRIRELASAYPDLSDHLNDIADHIIDLGPEGGDAGGTLVFSGTPEECANCAESYTGQYLKPLLEKTE